MTQGQAGLQVSWRKDQQAYNSPDSSLLQLLQKLAWQKASEHLHAGETSSKGPDRIKPVPLHVEPGGGHSTV